jgi:hypothetical protein
MTLNSQLIYPSDPDLKVSPLHPLSSIPHPPLSSLLNPSFYQNCSQVPSLPILLSFAFRLPPAISFFIAYPFC